MIAVARRRVPGARIEQGDLEELPFADASFDAVTGFNSFQYAASPRPRCARRGACSARAGACWRPIWAPPEMCELAGYLAAVGAQPAAAAAGAPGPFALSGDGALAGAARAAAVSSRRKRAT